MKVAIHVTEHQASEFARCAQAMYSKGCNQAGHMLSALSATYWGKSVTDLNETRRIDRAGEIYRAWLVFNEYPSAQEMD